MSWSFLMWLVSFILQAALLGMVMYTLICLSDLENDFINPHDSCTRVNRLVVPELVAQAVLTGLLLVSGKWFVAIFQIAVLAFHIHRFFRNDQYTDVTEIFKQLPEQKKRRILKLVLYLISFVIIIYRLVETAVTALLTPAGRKVAKQIINEAAAAIH
uniref:Cornichon family protein n=1 Tax=Tetraselmis chuii TaxID=63592 RepID=A0A7S1SUI6_9CHLO|mmetsp:Transcript_26320/g.46821  ORF Transcript_26320/g.46821 Transcript_26320/m.46821 type:complete len:158 (+) Transcript_26320:219-692(+)